MAAVSLTGSGNIGFLQPEWQVTEQCSPFALGDTRGSVGSASLDAAATSTSVFAIDNDFTLADETAGTWPGNVVGSPVTGGSVHLDVAGKLNFLVADRTVDPVWFVKEEPLLIAPLGASAGQVGDLDDVAIDPYDSSIFVVSSDTYAGVDRYRVIKFDSAGNYVTEFMSNGVGNGQFTGTAFLAVSPVDGSVFVAAGSNNRIQKFTPNGSRTTYTYSTKVGSNGTGNGQFGNQLNISIAVDSAGNIYAGDYDNNRIQKFNSSLVYQSQVTITSARQRDPFSVAVDAADNVYASVANLTTDLNVGGLINVYNSSLVLQRSITIPQAAGTNGGIYDIDLDSAGNIYANWGLGNYIVKYDPVGAELQRWYSGYPIAPDTSSNYALAVDRTTGRVVVGFRFSALAYYNNSTYGTYRVTSFRWSTVQLSDVIESYMRECDSTLGGLNYSYDAADDPDVVFPAWSGDVWSHLKEICAAYNLQIYVDGDTIRVDDQGVRSFTLEDNSPLKFTPTNIFGGQQLIITAQQPTAGGGIVFDAAAAGIRYQIDVGQVDTVYAATKNYPAQVDALVPTDALPVLPGQYYVLDSTGTHVPAATWLAAGAGVVAEVGDVPGQVAFTLTGPRNTMSGYTGPFTFADSLTSTGTGALSLTGSGTFTDPISFTFDTGANPTKTTQSVAATITNFAVDTVARLFSRAPEAIDLVSGVAVEVTFQIPTEKLLGFGRTLGAEFTTNDSRYRVTQVVWGALVSTVTAIRCASLDDIDTATTGRTVDQRDAIWAGYSVDDRTIKPLALGL